MQYEDVLAHYGVLGMKWGVRKDRESLPRLAASAPPNLPPAKWNVAKDGTLTVAKGSTISRVVRNHKGLFGGKGSELEEGKPLYAAFKPLDVIGYTHSFGRAESLFVKEASAVLKFEAKQEIKAPGPKEASRLFYDLAKKDPQFRADLESGLHGLAKRQLDRNIEEPESVRAYGAYTVALDGSIYNEKFATVREKYFAAVKQAGYNSVLDGSDASWDFDMPIIILDGSKTLDLKYTDVVTKASQEKTRLAFKSQYAKQGRTYLDKLGYI